MRVAPISIGACVYKIFRSITVRVRVILSFHLNNFPSASLFFSMQNFVKVYLNCFETYGRKKK